MASKGLFAKSCTRLLQDAVPLSAGLLEFSTIVSEAVGVRVVRAQQRNLSDPPSTCLGSVVHADRTSDFLV